MDGCSFVDSHLHLQDDRFSNTREQVMSNARNAGVGILLCNAVVETDWPKVLRLANRHNSVIPFLGIHPWYADSAAKGWQIRMEKVLGAFENPSGIGESGLDKTCAINFATQVAMFEAHLEAASRLLKPIALHCVRSWGTFVDILESHARHNSLPKTMIHSFNGSYETMKRLTDIGCYISYSPKITAADQDKIRRVVNQTPVAQLLLETDAPGRYNRLPTDDRGSVIPYAEPAQMPSLYRWVAQQRNINLIDFKKQLFSNAQIYTNQTFTG